MSIILKKNDCPNCGGPVGKLTSSHVTCPFCQSEFYLPPMPGFQIPAPRPDPQPPGLALVRVGNSDFRVHGRLARGRHCDVFWARRERALTEMVLLKIAHELGESALKNEWEALREIRQRDEYLHRLCPAPLLLGTAHCLGHASRPAAVFSWRPGFIFTALDARAEYPGGVDPRAAVWMWNRLLDILARLHSCGFRHGAIEAEHILLHPRDHGVALCGWSEAGRGSSDDLAQSGRVIGAMLGPSAPPALRDLCRQAAEYRHATDLKTKLEEISEAAFGPPRFHTFTLTGGYHGIR